MSDQLEGHILVRGLARISIQLMYVHSFTDLSFQECISHIRAPDFVESAAE